MWTCPECGKQFRNRNQWHSCYRLSLEDHLRNKPPHLKKTVEKLISEVKALGKIELNPVKSAIQVRSGATFLSIIPKKDHLQLEFQHKDEITDFPVHKIVKISGNRFYHYLYIQNEEDITPELLGWIRGAYELVKESS